MTQLSGLIAAHSGDDDRGLRRMPIKLERQRPAGREG
jgi:hypothetical protein